MLAVYVLLAVYLRYDSRRRNGRFYTWCRHANFGARLQPGSTPDLHQLLPSVGPICARLQPGSTPDFHQLLPSVGLSARSGPAVRSMLHATSCAQHVGLGEKLLKLDNH